MSRSASAAPRSPATVEKRANIGVALPISEKILALVYLVISCVTAKVPKAPAPLACIRRSGITSRSKCAIFSINHTFSSKAGPRLPAVLIFWLSSTGAPNACVSFFIILLSFVLGYWLLESPSPPAVADVSEAAAKRAIRYASGVLCISLPRDIAHDSTLRPRVWNRPDTYQSFSDTFMTLSCEDSSCRKMPDSGHGIRGAGQLAWRRDQIIFV